MPQIGQEKNEGFQTNWGRQAQYVEVAKQQVGLTFHGIAASFVRPFSELHASEAISTDRRLDKRIVD